MFGLPKSEGYESIKNELKAKLKNYFGDKIDDFMISGQTDTP